MAEARDSNVIVEDSDSALMPAGVREAGVSTAPLSAGETQAFEGNDVVRQLSDDPSNFLLGSSSKATLTRLVDGELLLSGGFHVGFHVAIIWSRVVKNWAFAGQ